MPQYRIKMVNKIAQEGIALFGSDYSVRADEKDPEGILVRSSPVDTDDYRSLLAVARAGAGVDTITVEKATAKGICVFNTPGANANAVAELVFVMLGISIRNIHRAIDFCHDLAGLSDAEVIEQVESKKAAFRGFELAGKTLGVLGIGKIGVRVANGGIHRQMRVIGFDPFPTLENIHNLSPEVSLARSWKEVVAQVHVLTLHMPFNEKLRSFINADVLNRLPKGAILVNHARGPLVDQAAVLAALDSGRLASYVTDFPTAAMLDNPKIIVSPHLGASTEESEEQSATMAVQELKDYIEYGAVTHSVNFPTAESFPSDDVHTRLIMINRDVPGMIGFASQKIGAHGINISSYLNESNGSVGYNIIDLESSIPESVVQEISAHNNVIRTRTIVFAHKKSA
ncbi:MAG TPA: 3-phosphoglycerate dehydrogenase family protein [Nitrospirota bacterium]|nr:3-phosphoglycerate dehydrogenase family protein [Nitrospirota bacterium]